MCPMCPFTVYNCLTLNFEGPQFPVVLYEGFDGAIRDGECGASLCQQRDTSQCVATAGKTLGGGGRETEGGGKNGV